MKDVAKSLHTVTVLVQVARANGGNLDLAMTILGLAGRPDPYGLKAAALKQLKS